MRLNEQRSSYLIKYLKIWFKEKLNFDILISAFEVFPNGLQLSWNELFVLPSYIVKNLSKNWQTFSQVGTHSISKENKPVVKSHFQIKAFRKPRTGKRCALPAAKDSMHCLFAAENSYVTPTV